MDTYLNQLKIFHVAAKEKCFTRAATVLFLTQPGISKHIKDLEGHYGTRLFDRLGKKVALTQAGEILFAKTATIFNMIEQLKVEIDELQGMKGGFLKIGASMTIGVYVLPPILGRFRDTYPQVDISLDVAVNRQVEENLLANAIDIGFLGAPAADARLVTGPFLNDELVVIVPMSHEWARRDFVPPHELINQTFVIAKEGSGTRRIIEARLADRGVTLKKTIEFGHTEAVKKAVESGLGVGILSKLVIVREEHLGLIKSLRLEGVDLTRTFFFAYRKDKYLSRVTKTFLQYAIYGKAGSDQ